MGRVLGGIFDVGLGDFVCPEREWSRQMRWRWRSPYDEGLPEARSQNADYGVWRLSGRWAS